MADRIILVCLPDAILGYRYDLWSQWCKGRSDVVERSRRHCRGDGWVAYPLHPGEKAIGIRAYEVICLGEAQGEHVVSAHMATIA